MRCEIEFLKERRDKSQAKLAIYRRKMIRYYNSNVKKKSFYLNDLVLQRVFLSTKEPGVETLWPNWESPYHVKEEV